MRWDWVSVAGDKMAKVVDEAMQHDESMLAPGDCFVDVEVLVQIVASRPRVAFSH